MNEQAPLILSIRQPWAWLILNGGKDIENRRWPTKVRGRILIHAAKGMTRAEYDEGMNFVVTNPRIPLTFGPPEFHELERGGLVGEVQIIDCVTQSNSKWFTGPFGFVLRRPVKKPFFPLKGQLGFFRSQELEGW